MALITGARLGPYEVVSRLGAGGTGEVYKARDTRLDRTVAIKVLPSEVAGDADRRARFEREARAVAALDHPHICGIYDVGHVDGTHYLVMPHLEGQTLAAPKLKSADIHLLDLARNVLTLFTVDPQTDASAVAARRWTNCLQEQPSRPLGDLSEANERDRHGTADFAPRS